MVMQTNSNQYAKFNMNVSNENLNNQTSEILKKNMNLLENNSGNYSNVTMATVNPLSQNEAQVAVMNQHQL